MSKSLDVILSLLKLALLVEILFFCFIGSSYATIDITIMWDANLESDLAGYIIYYRKSSNPSDHFERVIIKDPNVTSHIIYGLSETEKYIFWVTAYDHSNLESAHSPLNGLQYPYPELCDGEDDNCYGLLDKEAITFYLDRDGDGYGDENQSETGMNVLPGYVLNKIDCNDFDPNIHPKEFKIKTYPEETSHDFTCGRNLFEIFSPTCRSYNSFRFLRDFKEIECTLNFHYLNSRSGSINSTYWFFSHVTGQKINLPVDVSDNNRTKNHLNKVQFIVDRTE